MSRGRLQVAERAVLVQCHAREEHGMATGTPLEHDGKASSRHASPRPHASADAGSWLRRAAAFLRRPQARLIPVAAITAGLAAVAIGGIWSRSHHPAVPLDDAFIHFQYAKRLASGHFFSYAEGDSYSSGATSLLWPLLLAPFYA